MHALLSKLLKVKREPRRLASIPDEHRLYAIGDVHGRADLLSILLTQINAELESYDGHVWIVFLGDYIDRGRHSRDVVEGLSALKDTQNCSYCFLLGNHEQTMLDFLADAPASEHWLRYGGIETIESYGVAIESSDLNASSLSRIRGELSKNLPKAHLDFLKRLSLTFELGEYFFCHAGVRPNIPLKAQALDDLLWMREPFLSSQQDFGQVIVHGHSIHETPVVKHNRIGIDTGAFASGCLTALVLEGSTQRFLFTKE